MEEYASMVKRQRKGMLYLLVAFLLGVVFTPYNSIFLGLFAGGIVSYFNLWLLQRNVNKLGKAVAGKGAFKGGLGTFTRLVLAALAVFLALRFEEFFHIIAVIIGVMSSYFILGLDMLLQIFVKSRKDES